MPVVISAFRYAYDLAYVHYVAKDKILVLNAGKRLFKSQPGFAYYLHVEELVPDELQKAAAQQGLQEYIIVSEYGTTVVGLEMMRSVNEENVEENRKVQVVKSAFNTLSFSELEAITHIFEELDGDEGILVASKIADRVGITRSVIVNALRKFESAGVIESRSSGMKGTYIKVLNDYIFDELDEIKARKNLKNKGEAQNSGDTE